ncbi:hypothetical protein [Comamonas aquatica]|uniref:Uncharacterized protein n=1 Tax=Comamonas aquatica TaxID=225991 RepID=A0AA42I1F9_9BURK|nr:hypothetical protein [Comamonas aquatica]MDH0364230.1 hypothetical protein [Comamonas aquatica]
MNDEIRNELNTLAQATASVTTVLGLLVKHLVASGNLDAQAMRSTLDMYRQDVEASDVAENEKKVTRSVLRLIDTCLTENSTSNGKDDA